MWIQVIPDTQKQDTSRGDQNADRRLVGRSAPQERARRRERNSDPAQERCRLPVDLLSAGAVHAAERPGQAAAEGREREGDPERDQERNEDGRDVGHGPLVCSQCR
jgi:hypothetical protein